MVDLVLWTARTKNNRAAYKEDIDTVAWCKPHLLAEAYTQFLTGGGQLNVALSWPPPPICFQFLVLYTVYSSGLADLHLSHSK